MKHLNPQPAPLAIRLVLPGLLVWLVSAVTLVPTPDFVFGRIQISLPLIYVFHWTLFRPEGVHWAVIIVLGLFADLWNEAVIGLTPLLLLGFQNVLTSVRDDLSALDFEWRWATFAVLSAFYFSIFAVVTDGLFQIGGAGIDLVGRWLTCTGFYPIAILAFVALERRVLYPRRKA